MIKLDGANSQLRVRERVGELTLLTMLIFTQGACLDDTVEPSQSPINETPSAGESSPSVPTQTEGPSTPSQSNASVTATQIFVGSASPTYQPPSTRSQPSTTLAPTASSGVTPSHNRSTVTPTASPSVIEVETAKPTAEPTEAPTPTTIPTPLPTATVQPTPTLSFSEQCAIQAPQLVDQPLRRLSRTQYGNALKYVAYQADSESAAYYYNRSLQEAIAEYIPPDQLVGDEHELRGGFYILDQTVFQEHVEGWSYLAYMLAYGSLRYYGLDRIQPDCRINNLDTCLEPTIEAAGLLAHRRPLTEEQVAFYVDVYEQAYVTHEAPEGHESPSTYARDKALQDLVAVIFTSPYHLYHIEHGGGIGTDGQPDDELLTAYELANRLSFHFWQSMPDAQLFAAAEDGSLLTDDGYEAQVSRLMSHENARDSVGAFFREWLRIDGLPEMNRLRGTEPFESFAGDLDPSATLNNDMIQEVVDLSLYHSLDNPSTLEDYLLSRVHVSQSTELSSIYGMEPWDGVSEPVELVEEARVGLLTRAAMVASGSTNSRPIMKGISVFEGLMCQTLGEPPENAAAFPPDPSPDSTTREVIETLTEEEGSSCIGCHGYLINPYGFVTEDFDGLGRHRSMEVLYDASGNVTGEKPVNTADVALVDWAYVDVANASELTASIAQSAQFTNCFSEQYLRYTFGRAEDHTKDACALHELNTLLSEGQTLDQVLRAIAFRPEFRRRSFSGEELQ